MQKWRKCISFLGGLLLLLIPLQAKAQRYDNIAITATGQAIVSPTVAVCKQPAVITTTPCSPLATLYTDGTFGTTAANPFTGSTTGNYSFYAKSTDGPFTVQLYNGTPTISPAFVLQDQSVALSNVAQTNVANTFSQAQTFSGAVIAPAIGPTSVQQHTLPAVTSDTIALLTAAQTFTNKTLTSPTIGGTVTDTAATTFSGNNTHSGTETFTGTISGGASGLALASGGTNQNITLTPGTGGQVVIPSSLDIYAGPVANGNIFVGHLTGNSTLSGVANLGIGYQAAPALTSGNYNVALGNAALQGLTSGTDNTAIGYSAGVYLTTDSEVTAIGKEALNQCRTAGDCSYNTAVGSDALGLSYAAYENTAIGSGAMFEASQPNDDVALGKHALYQVTSGFYNVALGAAALYSTTSGGHNIGIGYLATYLTPPDSFTLALSNATANLSVGTYYYKISWVLNGSETELNESAGGKTITTTASFKEVTITGVPIYSGPLTCTARKIYRTKVNTALGNQLWYLVATIADNTTATYVDSIADSSLVTTDAGPSGSIIIGYGATAADHTAYKSGQFVVGTDDAPISELWIGRGVVSATPSDLLFSATGASGANTSGGNLILSGGPGTGTAASGAIILKAAGAGAAGSLWNSVSEVARVNGTGLGIGLSPSYPLDVTSSTAAYSARVANSASGGSGLYATGSGGGTAYGIYAAFSGNAASNGTAIFGNNTETTATIAYGVQGLSNGGNTANYGVLGSAAGGGATNNYGVEGAATGSTSGTNTGGYFTASGGSGGNYSLITNSGNVGIGTPTPTLQLQVAKSIASGINSVTFSATPTFDASLGNTQSITLTGNVTSSTLSNAAAGEGLNFNICQDATGSRTFVWPTNVLNPPTINSTASSCTYLSGTFDGTNLQFPSVYFARNVQFNGSTSGATTVIPQAVASGTLTLPATTDTLTGKATTDTFTNKTLDTAGAGNVLKINGTQVSAVTGTGSVVLATSPSLTTPSLGAATATSLTGLTGAFTPNAAGGTDVGSASLPFANYWLGGAATNNAKLTGTFTAARVFTVPDTASDTFTLNAATQTLTNKTLTSPTINTTIGGSPTFPAPGAIGGTTPAAGTFTTLGANTQLNVNGALVDSATAPTLTGFGTSPSVVANSGTAAFEINVGTGGTASTGTITFPAAAHGWAVHCDDVTTQSTSVSQTQQTAFTTTTAVVTQYSDVHAATAWAASDILVCQARAF